LRLIDETNLNFSFSRIKTEFVFFLCVSVAQWFVSGDFSKMNMFGCSNKFFEENVFFQGEEERKSFYLA